MASQYKEALIQNMEQQTTQISIVHRETGCGCIRFCKRLWTFASALLSFSFIGSIISEILLLVNVYSHHDIKFFILSLMFLTVPTLFASFIIFVEFYVEGFLFYVPILNIPFAVAYTKIEERMSPSNWGRGDADITPLISTFLVGTMSFPLYIINLSFLLEQKKAYSAISFFNYLQLILSIFCFLQAPISFILEQSKMANSDWSLSRSCKILFWSSVGFVPVILIEIIHFFPFLFCYYVDETLYGRDLLWIIIIFNVPKLIFVVHVTLRFNEGRFFYALTVPILITVPLVPYLLLTLDVPGEVSLCRRADSMSKIELRKDAYQIDVWESYLSELENENKRQRKSSLTYYVNLVVYLMVSYGGSCLYVVIRCGFNALSTPVKVSVILIISIIAFIVCIFPVAFKFMKLNGANVHNGLTW